MISNPIAIERADYIMYTIATAGSPLLEQTYIVLITRHLISPILLHYITKYPV